MAVWNHNTYYHPLILAALPTPSARALDIGCGTGEVSRKLAARCAHVLAIDRDQAILGVATSAADSLHNVRYLRADFLTYPFAPASFDFITAVATLHHLPLAQGLTRMLDLLAPEARLPSSGCTAHARSRITCSPPPLSDQPRASTLRWRPDAARPDAGTSRNLR